MSKLALITGGAGFVGSHLADGLLARGYRVRCLDNFSPQVHDRGIPNYLNPEIEMLFGDVRDREALDRALRDVDYVFHFAAAVGVGQSMYEISRYMSINTQGTAQLLQSILDTKAPVRKMVVASSMSIYGEGSYECVSCGRVTPPIRSAWQLKSKRWNPSCPSCEGDLRALPTAEDKPSETTSVYALSKRDQEELCMIFGRTYGVPVTALRFFNIYGTRQSLSNPYTGVAAIFASRLLNDQAPLVFEDGEQLRDFVSVRDIVRANILAIESRESDGHVINIGSGAPITIRKVAELLGRPLGKEVKPIITQKSRAGDIRHCYADLTRAEQLLGYRPAVSHEEGFAELVEWLKLQQPEDRAEDAMRELVSFGLSA